jgi:lathosterol oxidase
MPLWLSPYAIGAFLVIFLGYLATNAVLHICFYERRAEEAKSWKIQSRSPASSPTDVNAGNRIPWPWRSDKTGRSPQHALYATLNLIVASSFALLTAEGTVRGMGSQLHTRGPPSGGLLLLLLEWLVGQAGLVVLGLFWQSVWEYYWHRFMHVPVVYRRFHKHHHFYKAPSPFDDMFIAPLEVSPFFLPFVLLILSDCARSSFHYLISPSLPPSLPHSRL